MKRPNIVPILLAAGSSDQLGFPKPLARFGHRTALEIAMKNCAGLARPIVVLGSNADAIQKSMLRGARVVINRRWKRGQLSSLLAGLRRVPRGAAFLIYPVDHPLVTREIVEQIAHAFEERPKGKAIIMPKFRRYHGHPVICAAEIRGELKRARTAREVIYRDMRRVQFVYVATSVICRDFSDPASYLACLQRFPLR
ncbi:MAG TPA: NTP transferase domain-containing protein [Candidatus Acidoferrales bacterium]|nr:NTP transferase domain-containing protein [Candidatus Acidoferrales bacterium]